jgi:hypothetical protein
MRFRFLSRAPELGQVLERLGAAEGGALAVVGGRGSGRSTLLRAVTESVEQPAVMITADRREASWPLSGLAAVLSAVDRAHGSDLLGAMPDAPGEQDEYAIVRSLHERFRAEVTEPVVVVVDDADHMDEASRTILGFLVRSLGTGTVRFVVAVEELSSESPFGGIDRLDLGPVAVARLVELGRSIVPGPAQPDVLDHVARLAAGSPLALLSLLGELPAPVLRGEAPLPVPQRPGKPLVSLLLPRLEGLSEAETGVLRVLATADATPASVLAAVRADGRDDAQADGRDDARAGVAAAVEELIARDLVHRDGERLRLQDPLWGPVLYWSIPAAQRLRLHEELAALCAAEHPALRAWHRSHLAADPAAAAPLLAGARSHLRRREVLAGIACAERALALPGGTERHEELERLVMSCLLATELTAARRYLKLVQGEGVPFAISAMAGILRVCLDFLHLQTVNDDVVAAVLDARREEDPQGCADLLCVVAICRLERGEPELVRSALAAARELAGADAGDIALLERIADLHEAAVRGRELPALAALQSLVAGATGRVSREVLWILVARALGGAERFDDARRMLDIVSDEVAGVAPVWIEHSWDVRHTLELRAGRLDRVRRMLALLDGDLDVARARSEEASALLLPGVSASLRARVALAQARIALAERRLGTAIGAFEQADVLTRGLTDPLLLQAVAEHVEALVAAGRAPEARTLAEGIERRSWDAPSAWAVRAARRSRARAHGGGVARGVRRAARRLGGRRAPPAARAPRAARRAGTERTGTRAEAAGHPDGRGAGRRPARGRGQEEPGHRQRAVRLPAHRRDAPDLDLPQDCGGLAIRADPEPDRVAGDAAVRTGAFPRGRPGHWLIGAAPGTRRRKALGPVVRLGSQGPLPHPS